LDSFTATFGFEKETKNTYKFQEVAQAGNPPRIGSLYLQKWNFKTRPEKVKVTVEAE
jgi:hypothetical protein